MNTMNLDMLKEFGNGGYAQARALGELNLRTWERLFEKQMETFGLLIDNANAQIELASEAREVSDMKAQVCRYLVKDFGTSQSPKSTRQRDSRYCPD
ncbi:MAG: hypothetical protein AB2812_03455, partial [Candidatus Sedimenticola endophacoides]